MPEGCGRPRPSRADEPGRRARDRPGGSGWCRCCGRRGSPGPNSSSRCCCSSSVSAWPSRSARPATTARCAARARRIWCASSMSSTTAPSVSRTRSRSGEPAHRAGEQLRPGRGGPQADQQKEQQLGILAGTVAAQGPGITLTDRRPAGHGRGGHAARRDPGAARGRCRGDPDQRRAGRRRHVLHGHRRA